MKGYLDECMQKIAMQVRQEVDRRKQKSEREIELDRWRALYSDCVKRLWSEDACAAMLFAMLLLCVLTLFICLDNVSDLKWMYGYLKVVMCVSSPFAAGVVVWGIFYVCIHIRALFSYPYPLPKFNFKQTYKFGK